MSVEGSLNGSVANVYPDRNWQTNPIDSDQQQFITNALEKDLVTDDKLRDDGLKITKVWELAEWTHLLIAGDAWKGSLSVLFECHYRAIEALMYDHSIEPYHRVRLIAYDRAAELSLVGSADLDEIANLRRQIAERDERVRQLMESFADAVPNSIYQVQVRRAEKAESERQLLQDEVTLLKKQLANIGQGIEGSVDDGKDPVTGIAILAAAAMWFISKKNKN